MSILTFYIMLGIIILLVAVIWYMATRPAVVSHRTIDGGFHCPYPGMTDEELYAFECYMFRFEESHLRTWQSLEEFNRRNDAKEVKGERVF